MTPQPQDMPFDRALRRLRRNRALRMSGDAWLWERIGEELLERLSWVNRTFSDALLLGMPSRGFQEGLRARGLNLTVADIGHVPGLHEADLCCDEDRLPFAPGSFDLVVAVGGLDSVNDLPGALLLIRRALRPDGLFLGGMIGAGSLSSLRKVMLTADDLAGSPSPRIHPQIDVRAAGDLLGRAGFAMPVADSETLTVRYPSLFTLIGDLRAHGGTNLMARRDTRPIGRAALAAGAARFSDDAAEDGKTAEQILLLYLSGWAPSPDQPKPARRGSATASLASALARKPE